MLQRVTGGAGVVRAQTQILHVIGGLAVRQGGPALNVVGIARAIRAAGGWNAIFATDTLEAASAGRYTRVTPEDLPPEAAALSIELFPVRPPRRILYSPALRRELRRYVGEFDVVHIHSLYLYPQYAAFREARAKGKPHVVTIHGVLDPALRVRSRRRKSVMDRLWQREMLDTAAAIHFTTEEERALVADLDLQAPSFVIPNGIDFEQFRRPVDAGGLYERLGVDPSGAVLFLGRITHKKGLELLIPALAEVARTRPEVSLVVAGPDDERLTPRLRVLAEQHGVGERVVWAGLLTGNDRLAAFQGCAMWILPSLSENFGTTVIEAMASGAPTIVGEGVNLAGAAGSANATVVVPRDNEAIAAAIGRLLDRPDERARLVAAGLAFARGYDWSIIGPELYALYQSVAAAGPR